MEDRRAGFRDINSVRVARFFVMALVTLFTAANARAAAPIGQTIWLKAAATGGFVSADTNRGAFAPLVADRTLFAGPGRFEATGDALARRGVFRHQSWRCAA